MSGCCQPNTVEYTLFTDEPLTASMTSASFDSAGFRMLAYNQSYTAQILVTFVDMIVEQSWDAGVTFHRVTNAQRIGATQRLLDLNLSTQNFTAFFPVRETLHSGVPISGDLIRFIVNTTGTIVGGDIFSLSIRLFDLNATVTNYTA